VYLQFLFLSANLSIVLKTGCHAAQAGPKRPLRLMNSPSSCRGQTCTATPTVAYDTDRLWDQVYEIKNRKTSQTLGKMGSVGWESA
ncbi:hypothetical protein LEMLEM_LOCUS20153, partial [Lemmus lemmus]